VALTALGGGYRQAARAPLQGVAADLVISRPAGQPEAAAQAQRTRGVRLPFGLAPISTAEVATVTEIDGVAATASALEVWDFGPTRYQTVLGLDLTRGDIGPGRAVSEGLIAGRALRPGERGVAVADRHFAAFFGLRPGAAVMIGGQPFTVVGVAEQPGVSQGAAPNFYIPIADAQALAGLAPDQVDQVYVRVTHAGETDVVVASIARTLGPVSAITESSLLQVMGGIGQVSARFAAVASLVGLIGGMALSWLALSGLVAERSREIGVMKAVGWRSADVARVFLAEAVVLSITGGLLGLAIGLGGGWLLGHLPLPTVTALGAATLPGLSAGAPAESTITVPVQVSPWTLALALGASVAGGALAAGGSAYRAAALKPTQALRRP
jgi:putative ABC transport system permease protein